MSKEMSFMTEIALENSAASVVPTRPTRLVGNFVDLVPSHKLSLVQSGAPIHVFHILNKDSLVVGEVNLILDTDLPNVQYVGHFGGSFTERAQNPEIMAETASLLFPIAKEHGLTEILVTTRLGDKVVQKACELLRANPLDCITVPQTHAKKKTRIKRFIIKLS